MKSQNAIHKLAVHPLKPQSSVQLLMALGHDRGWLSGIFRHINGLSLAIALENKSCQTDRDVPAVGSTSHGVIRKCDVRTEAASRGVSSPLA